MRNPIRTYVGTCVIAMLLVVAITCLSPFSTAELSSPTAGLSRIGGTDKT